MQNTAFIGMRVPSQLKAALEAAAGTPGARGSNGRATTLAKEILTERLIQDGYLQPEEGEHEKSEGAQAV